MFLDIFYPQNLIYHKEF